MSRGPDYDIRLRIVGGDGVDGALDITDLEALVQFIRGAAAHDPSLANLALVDVQRGSRVALFKAQPHQGIPGLLSTRNAIADLFPLRSARSNAPVEFPKGILDSFRTLARCGAKVQVSYTPENAKRPRRMTFDQQSLAPVKVKRNRLAPEKELTGRLIRLHSDESCFGVDTVQGQIQCPFPSHDQESWVALYERIVRVRVKAPSKPASGPWKATETLDIEVLPDPPSLDFTDEIPGLVPPKHARKGGFHLDDLFPGLEPEDADSLSLFLQDYRGRSS